MSEQEVRQMRFVDFYEQKTMATAHRIGYRCHQLSAIV